MTATKGRKLQLEAPRRDMVPSTAAGADKTTANFFHPGAVFLLCLGPRLLRLVVFHAIVDSSAAVEGPS
jgi:hypothetical protein